MVNTLNRKKFFAGVVPRSCLFAFNEILFKFIYFEICPLERTHTQVPSIAGL